MCQADLERQRSRDDELILALRNTILEHENTSAGLKAEKQNAM